MRIFIKALLVAFVAGFLTSAYAQTDTYKCDKLTGAEKEKCIADARK